MYFLAPFAGALSLALWDLQVPDSRLHLCSCVRIHYSATCDLFCIKLLGKSEFSEDGTCMNEWHGKRCMTTKNRLGWKTEVWLA
jgi:hypothetical protein